MIVGEREGDQNALAVLAEERPAARERLQVSWFSADNGVLGSAARHSADVRCDIKRG